mgnify:CR=1 FL=1
MPQQTQIGGVWLREDIVNDTAKVEAISLYFAQQLAELRLHYYYQHYPINSPIVEPMRGLKFKIKERITYRIEDLSDLDKVIKAFSKNKNRRFSAVFDILFLIFNGVGHYFRKKCGYSFHIVC